VGKTEVIEDNLSQCDSVHHKSQNGLACDRTWASESLAFKRLSHGTAQISLSHHFTREKKEAQVPNGVSLPLYLFLFLEHRTMDEIQKRSLNTAHHRHHHRELNRSMDFCLNTMFLKNARVHVYCKLCRQPLRQKIDVLTIKCKKHNTQFGQSALPQLNESTIAFTGTLSAIRFPW
jgi:hypothetical protein